MKKVVWIKRLSVVFLAAVVMTVAFAVINGSRRVGAESIFIAEDKVETTANAKVSDSFLNGKTGIMVSSAVSGKGFRLKNSVAGEFYAEFMPAPENIGYADFEELSFSFSSQKSRIGFTVKFIRTDSGVTLRLVFSNALSLYKDYRVSGSFDGLAESPVSFRFDPYEYVIYDSENSPVIRLDSKELLEEFYASVPLGNFDVYDVTVRFGGIKANKTAKVVFFDLCGQSLSGSSIKDDSAPIIADRNVVLDGGVAGSEYTLNEKIATYDVIDGLSENFKGEITVVDANNNPVTVKNGRFVPQKAGKYYARYTAKDNAGNKGETKSFPFVVYEKTPSAEFVMSFPVSDKTVGAGTKLSFPSVSAVSKLTENAVKVRAEIEAADGASVYSNEDCADGFDYTFDNAGVYSLVYTAFQPNGSAAVCEYKITVLSDAPVYKTYLASEYSKDVNLDLSVSSCEYNGQSLALKYLTVYPSGKTQDSSVITLDENGVYKTVLSVDGSDVVYEKFYTVKNDNLSLWEENNGITFTADAVAPDYADADYNGVMLTASRASEAVYKNVIDLSDNTKSDLLCEFFVCPTVAGTIETATVDIILTDVYNENNVVDIRFTKGIWFLGKENIMMSVMALTQRDYTLQTLQEVNKTGMDTQRLYYYNTTVYSSLYGKMSGGSLDYPSQSVRVYFDYETGCVYVDNASQNGYYGRLLVCDLTDEKYVGTSMGYKKFTTGEAKLSVKISDVYQTAHVMVLNVDGQNLSGVYTDDVTPPSVFADYDGNSESDLPVGVEGKPFRIFDAYSIDLVDGKNDNVGFKVYKKGEILSECELVGNEFVPETAGEYIIRYTAADMRGYTAVKDVTITVIEADDYVAPEYTFSDENAATAFVGSEYFFKSGTVRGGTGRVTRSITLVKNGESHTLNENEGFAVDTAGLYEIFVTLKDYVSVCGPFKFTVNAEYSDKPVIRAATLPEAVTVGDEVVLPEFSAKLYSEKAPDGENAEIKFIVNGKELDGNSFIPEVAGDIAVTVKAGNTELNYTIKAVEKIVGNKYENYPTYTKQFFYTNAKTAEPSAISIDFTFDRQTRVVATRKISSHFIDFVLVGNADRSGCSEIRCELKDAADPSVVVTLVIEKKNASESYLVINGEKYIISGSFSNPNMSFKISCDGEAGMVTAGTKKLGKIGYCDNGAEFKGFSDEIYLAFDFAKVDGESTVGIQSIAGQSFNSSVKRDRTAPSIKLLGSFGETQKGGTITVPAAKAFDFISGVKALSVSVYAPDGTALKENASADAPIEIKAEMTGSYRVLYSARDNSGIATDDSANSYYVRVADVVPPEIVIAGSVPDSFRAGKSVKLPEMSVTDDNTPADKILQYVYYIAPSGLPVRIKNYEFLPEETGLYVIIYFAQDADGATTIKKFFAEVK